MLKGWIDRAEHGLITGWAYAPGAAVMLTIEADGAPLGTVRAEQFRPDVEQAGHGDGYCGFTFEIAPPLASGIPHEITIRNAATGESLPGVPRLLQAVSYYDASLRATLSQAIDALIGAEDAALEDLQAFLEEQTERLRACRLIERGALPAPTINGRRGRHALVIDSQTPNAARDAGSEALISHMRGLRSLGYAVTFIPASGMASAAERAALSAAGIFTLAQPAVKDVEHALRLAPRPFDLAYLHRPETAARYGGLVRHYGRKTRIVYAVADLDFLRLTRQAQITNNLELMRAAQNARARHDFALGTADAVITHSSAEAELIRAAAPKLPVHAVPWTPQAQPAGTNLADRSGIVFLAFYSHEPNRDAALLLVRNIMPLVWRQNPDIILTLAGSFMPPEITGLADARIKCLGQISSATELLATARLTAAPLRFGAGIKGKVISSLAAGLPCAMTPIAAEGLDLPAALTPCIANNEPDFARIILSLHDDPAFNTAMAEAGRAWAAQALNPARINALLAAATGQPEMLPAANAG